MVTIQGNRYLSDFEAKKAMIEAGKRMDMKGYVVAGDGSLSVRTGPNAVWITVAGADKGNLTQDMFVKVGLDGKQVISARNKELPPELPFHLNVYQENPEARAVVQAYPPMANLAAFRGKGLEAASYTTAVKKLGAIPFAERAEYLKEIVRTVNGVLIHNVGCITWGDTMIQAYYYMEAAEYHAGMDMNLEKYGCQPELQMSAAESRVNVLDTQEFKGVSGLVRPGTINIPVNIPAEQTYSEKKTVRAVDVPRADVMAEVVRRRTANFGN